MYGGFVLLDHSLLTPPCEHCAAPIRCAPLVKEGRQGKPRCNFQNNQNYFHGTVTKEVTVSGLKVGFPDPGLFPVFGFLGLMYAHHDRI